MAVIRAYSLATPGKGTEAASKVSLTRHLPQVSVILRQRCMPKRRRVPPYAGSGALSSDERLPTATYH